MIRGQSRVIWALLAIFLLGSYVRLYGLEKYYFWADEAVVLLLSKDLSLSFLSHLRQEPHPPLYYFLVKLVMNGFGVDHPLLLRSISLLSGLLTIGVAYFLGLKLTSKRSVGVFASFLLATAPLCIEQSQLVRVYSLLLLWLLMLVFCLIEEPFKKSYFWLSCLFLILATLTHFSSVVLFPAICVFGLLKVRKLKQHKRLYQVIWIAVLAACGSFVLVGKVLAPQNLVTGHIQSLYSASAGSPFKATAELLKIWGGFYGNQMRGIPVFAIFSILIGLAYLWRDKKQDLFFFVFGTYATAFVFSVIGIYPLVSGRHSMVLLAPTLLPTLWFLNRIGQKRPVLLALFGALILFQFRSPQTIFSPDNLRWSFGEGSPKFEELRSAAEAIKNGVSGEKTILMDWGKYVAVLLEKKLSPKWAVFSVANQNYESCTWGAFSTKAGVCDCIIRVSSQGSTRKEVVLVTAGATETENVLAAAEAGQSCGIRKMNATITGSFSILSGVL